jgi:hypothetical protein
MEARIEANNEKFEALRGTLLSRMVIHQARTQDIQEEMEAKMIKNQERIEATKTLILEHTTRRRLEAKIAEVTDDFLEGL